MGKFIKMEADDVLAEKIKKIADELSISRYVDVQPRYLTKPLKNSVGSVYKGNDVSTTITNRDNTVVVAIYGEAFDRVDEQTQDFWLRNLISQIEYDFDKDKINICKNMITIPLGIYQNYGQEAIDKKELEILTLNQLADEEKERKAAEKEMKKAAKKKNKS